MGLLTRALIRLFRRPAPRWDPLAVFHSGHYQRHNERRLEHLASLDLDLAGRSVLEVGAGIGDHTQFYLERGCHVTSSDGRAENLTILRGRYPDLRTMHLNLDEPPASFIEQFDIVHCYGILYHLKESAAGLAFLARCCRRMLLLETRVSYGEAECVHPCVEDARIPSHSLLGRGCRPTRPWVFARLKELFPFVYLPSTQPDHEEFPLDWTTPPATQQATRAIFIASRQEIRHPLLVEEIPSQQSRFEGCGSALKLGQ